MTSTSTVSSQFLDPFPITMLRSKNPIPHNKYCWHLQSHVGQHCWDNQNLLFVLADVLAGSLYPFHTLQYVMESLSGLTTTLYLALVTAVLLTNAKAGDFDDILVAMVRMGSIHWKRAINFSIFPNLTSTGNFTRQKPSGVSHSDYCCMISPGPIPSIAPISYKTFIASCIYSFMVAGEPGLKHSYNSLWIHLQELTSKPLPKIPFNYHWLLSKIG